LSLTNRQPNTFHISLSSLSFWWLSCRVHKSAAQNCCLWSIKCQRSILFHSRMQTYKPTMAKWVQEITKVCNWLIEVCDYAQVTLPKSSTTTIFVC